MEARAGGDVEIQIRMVHAVEPPERRHRVKHDMLQVNHQI